MELKVWSTETLIVFNREMHSKHGGNQHQVSRMPKQLRSNLRRREMVYGKPFLPTMSFHTGTCSSSIQLLTDPLWKTIKV